MTWSIYGNRNDLTSFVAKHPGGKEILEKTRDIGDIMPLFESYHALSDKTASAILGEIQIGGCR
jgi:cytochrome b involved in lipid metabolism